MRIDTTSSIRRFLRDESGMASLEFAIFFPALCVIFFMMAEVAVFQARAVLLDRGVDTAVRELRIGAIENPTHENIKNRICEMAYLIETSCARGLRLEFITINPDDGTFQRPEPNCRDISAEEAAGDFNPAEAFNVDAGDRTEIMFVSACLVIRPVIPNGIMGAQFRFRSPTSDSSRYALVAQSAFMNEPQ